MGMEGGGEASRRSGQAQPATPRASQQRPAGGGSQPPSGLFPTGRPPRPAYREPHPVRTGAVIAGLAAGTGWLLLFALLGGDLRGRIWWVVAAGALAWLVALVLARYGDRGVAVGVTIAVGAGWTVTAGLVALYLTVTGNFPLW
jgi:hypothetical protein